METSMYKSVVVTYESLGIRGLRGRLIHFLAFMWERVA